MQSFRNCQCFCKQLSRRIRRSFVIGIMLTYLGDLIQVLVVPVPHRNFPSVFIRYAH